MTAVIGRPLDDMPSAIFLSCEECALGFPLRSNIFNVDSGERKYFSRFPIQVAVLYSPRQQYFAESFRELFAVLDELTGDRVAFFAVLDPPEDWLLNRRNREWWTRYRARIGGTGFSIDDRVLIKEIARLFRLEWDSLPALVISTNLWSGEFVSTETSPDHIDVQLELLSSIAAEWDSPNIGHIIDSFQDRFGFELSYHRPDEARRQRLNVLYGTLRTAGDENRGPDIDGLQRIVDREMRDVDFAMRRMRGQAAGRMSRDSWDDPAAAESWNRSADDVIADAAGRLVAPAAVAERIIADEREHELSQYGIISMLDDESQVMVDTAIRVGVFLEKESSRLVRRRGDRSGRSWRHENAMNVDFAPGAQGAWKAFEREVNLSLVQAARHARSICDA